jgi:peptide/nickel transport system permease protein
MSEAPASGSRIGESFRRSPLAIAAAFACGAFALAAALAPVLAPIDPYDLRSQSVMDSHLPPAWSAEGQARFVLGTDEQGADLLSLMLYGMRLSLGVGLAAVSLSVAIGVTLGLIAGYRRGWIDAVVMRFADLQFTFPAILMAMLCGGIAASLLPRATRQDFAIPLVVIALGLSHWPHFARLVRGATMVEREKEYVAAARVLGLPAWRIMLRHVLPNVVNPILVLGTLDIAYAIMGEATLSFLGLGVAPNQPSLGALIRQGYAFLFSGVWWIVIFPCALLVALVVSINLLGDWLREALNPKLR